MSFRFSGWFVAALCLAGVVGCANDGRIVLRGRVVADGQPVPRGEPPIGLEVELQKEGAGIDAGTAYAAAVEPDGTFTVPGGDGKGIPPGTYKIAVRVTADAPGAKPKLAVPLNGLDDLATTPLRCDIAAADKGIVIDVKKKTVQKEP
jgi:hypothetical protein